MKTKPPRKALGADQVRSLIQSWAPLVSSEPNAQDQAAHLGVMITSTLRDAEFDRLKRRPDPKRKRRG
jgi:hypothetical protein